MDKLERPLSKYILKIFPEIFSASERFKSELLSILAKDSRENSCNEYLTRIYAFSTELFLDNKDKSDSPYLTPTINLISNIAKKEADFEQSICSEIENLIHNDEVNSTAILCFENLVKYSSYSIDRKTVIKLQKGKSLKIWFNIYHHLVVTGTETDQETRVSAFACWMYSLKLNPDIFNKNIRKAIDYVLDENTEEMTELAIMGIENISVEDLTETTIFLLSQVKTNTVKQQKRIMNILAEYIELGNTVSQEVINFIGKLILKLSISWRCIADQANKSTNEKIRKVATDLLKTLSQSSQVEMSEELKKQLELDRTFQECVECEKGKECKTMLKNVLCGNLKDFSFSASTSIAFSQLLKRDDFHKFGKYLFKMLSKLLDEKIEITHEFISEYLEQYGELSEYEEYVEILWKMVNIYDQFNWWKIISCVIREIKDKKNPFPEKWKQILVTLSKRNIQFKDKAVKKICWVLLTHSWDTVYDALFNIIENKNTISIEVGNKLEQLFNDSDNIERNIQLLEKATQLRYILSEDIIDRLACICMEQPKYWFNICTIFSNLNKCGFELPEDKKALSYFVKDIKILEDGEEEYSRKLEAIDDVIKVVNNLPAIPEACIQAIQCNLKLHQESELGHKCYKALKKLCRKDDNLLAYVDWKTIVVGIKNQQFEPIVLKLFSTATGKGIKFPPGVLSNLSRSSMLDQVVQLLIQYKETHGAFEPEDECWQSLINIHTRDRIESPEELNDYIQGKIIYPIDCIGEGNGLSQKALKTFKKSLKNPNVRNEIMNFLKSSLCLGNNIGPILDSYVRYIPTTERVAYIAPLLIQEVVDKDQLASSQLGK